MTKIERQFAIDLLRALDIGMEVEVKTIKEYEEDLFGETRKEILTAIREMISQGYKKELPNEKA